jgi:micrococcal nuclease
MYEYNVKEIVSIYDGDTMMVIVDLGFSISSQQTLRFYGINAPELRGDSHDNGVISRDWLREKIYTAMENGVQIKVKTSKDKTGKYGRLLAEVFIGDEPISLNKQMVTEGLAIEYMLD